MGMLQNPGLLSTDGPAPRSGALRENGNRAVENGVLSGYGDRPVVPGGETSRGQAAVMLARYGNDWNR